MDTLPHYLVSQLSLDGEDLQAISGYGDGDETMQDGHAATTASSVTSSLAAASTEEGASDENCARDTNAADKMRAAAGKKGRKKGLKGVTVSLDEFAEGGVTGLIDQKKAEHRKSLMQQHQIQMQRQAWAGAVPPPPPPPRGWSRLNGDAPEYNAAGIQGIHMLNHDEVHQQPLPPILAALRSQTIDIATTDSTPHVMLENINEAAVTAQYGSVQAGIEAVLLEKQLLPLRMLMPLPGTGSVLLSFFSAKQAYLALLLLHDFPLAHQKLWASMLRDLPPQEWLAEQLQQLTDHTNPESVNRGDKEPVDQNALHRACARAGVVELPTNLLEDESERKKAGGPAVVLAGFRQAAILGCNAALLEQYRALKSFKLKSSYLKDAASVCNPDPTAMLLLNLADCNLHGVWAAMGPEAQDGPGAEKYLEFSEVHPGAVLSPTQYGTLLHNRNGQLASPPMMLDAATTRTILQLFGTAPEDPGTTQAAEGASPPVSTTLTASYRPYIPASMQQTAKSDNAPTQQSVTVSNKESSSAISQNTAPSLTSLMAPQAVSSHADFQQQQQLAINPAGAMPLPPAGAPHPGFPLTSMPPGTWPAYSAPPLYSQPVVPPGLPAQFAGPPQLAVFGSHLSGAPMHRPYQPPMAASSAGDSTWLHQQQQQPQVGPAGKAETDVDGSEKANGHSVTLAPTNAPTRGSYRPPLVSLQQKPEQRAAGT